MKQSRLEKCEIAYQLGYTYNPETGEFFGTKGQKVGHFNRHGYECLFNPKFKHLHAHHYAWYYVYGDVDFEQLDHINRDKTDNRISNLRIANFKMNSQNKASRGYWYCNTRKKFKTSITLGGKMIKQYFFDTEEEARAKYLELKSIYHTYYEQNI